MQHSHPREICPLSLQRVEIMTAGGPPRPRNRAVKRFSRHLCKYSPGTSELRLLIPFPTLCQRLDSYARDLIVLHCAKRHTCAAFKVPTPDLPRATLTRTHVALDVFSGAHHIQEDRHHDFHCLQVERRRVQVPAREVALASSACHQPAFSPAQHHLAARVACKRPQTASGYHTWPP